MMPTVECRAAAAPPASGANEKGAVRSGRPLA